MAAFAVARLTIANTLRQPVTWLVVASGCALVGLGYLFGMFTWKDADRIRLLASAGVGTAAILGMFLGVLTANQSIHDELASRTALTLFAKPLPRHAFLLGKILGVFAVVCLVVLVLASAHLIALGFGLRFGFQHHGHPPDIPWFSWSRILTAHLLALAGNATLVCLSAVLALRVGFVVNLLLCFAVFVLGHLLGPWLGTGAFLVLPPLHIFAVDDALAFPEMLLTWRYLLTSILSALFYAGSCIAFGIVLIRRLDIS